MKNESYQLTPKGFITNNLVLDEDAYSNFENSLVRYMSRIGCNAIVFHENDLHFVSLERSKK